MYYIVTIFMNLLYQIKNYYLYYVLIINNINYCKCVVIYFFVFISF